MSRDTGRQVGLLIDRMGVVDKVVVGDAHQLVIPDLGRDRAGAARFRGLRLVHTHLRNEALARDDLTDLALLRLDGVLVVHAGSDGLPGALELAHLLPPGSAEPHRVERIPAVHAWEHDFTTFIRDLEHQFRQAAALRDVPGRENAVLVSVTTEDPRRAQRTLEELERLAETAGLHTVDRVLQVRRELDGRTLVGQGKLRELVLRCMHLGAGVIVFDQELSPSQLRNIATETELKVLDRTQLILDIFSQRATTKEGKLQVELAQLRYRKPRLALMPTAMSRLTGGIGGRGPGETKLEINRRRADERETRLQRQLAEIARARAMRRDRRRRVGLPLVAIVGYTNAGKSTLLNTLTRSAVTATDSLFATLDPTSRRLRFVAAERDEDGAVACPSAPAEIVLTDTVGFIRDLPRDLVHAFRSTLDEALEADLLLHVADASDEDVEAQKASVEAVLRALGAGEVPCLVVLNKADAADPELLDERARAWDATPVVARTGEGLGPLLARIERALWRASERDDAEGVAADPDR